MSKRKISIGIDIGGTNSKYGIVDQDGQVLFSNILSTADYTDPAEFVQVLSQKAKDAILSHEEDIELAGIGIGAPNGNYYKGTIEFAPNLPWKDLVPLTSLFKKYFNVPVVLTNDANAAAIGEMVYGGAKNMDNFIELTLGTGLGSGVIVNGDLVYGHDGFAGELGHVRVKLNGRECGCGRRGCLETYVSATGLKRTVYKLLSDTLEPSRLRGVPFNDLTAKNVSEAAEKGDKIALEAFEYTGRIFGQAIADFVAFTSPKAIFLFGGLANAGDFIFNPTKKHFKANVMPVFKNKVDILPSEINENHGAILGASALIWKELDKIPE